MAWSVVLVLAMGGVRADDLDSLSGTWSLASWEEGGQAVAKERLEGAKLVLDGDVFRVALAPPGEPRPKALATEAESGQWLHVWHRVKE
jgi:hypothetical protein